MLIKGVFMMLVHDPFVSTDKTSVMVIMMTLLNSD